MDLLTSILYGIIQGLAEFLPVSSSGHLAIFRALTGSDLESFVAFEVLLHLGTFLAVIVMYYKDVWELIKHFFTLCGKLFKGKAGWKNLDAYEKLVVLLIIATIPLLVSALVDHLLEALTTMLVVIGAILLLNACMLLLSDRLAKRAAGKTLEEAKPLDAALIGICQFFAVLPGLSRSGTVITGSLWRGLTREEAVRFALLTSLPTMFGACVLKLPELFTSGTEPTQMLIYAAGAVAAFVVGLLAVGLLRLIARKGSFRGFAYYCFAVGAAAIVYGIVR